MPDMRDRCELDPEARRVPRDLGIVGLMGKKVKDAVAMC